MIIPAGLVDPFYCGCETTPAQRGLLSVDQALRRALALVETVTDIKRLPLEKAYGRVLGETVWATVLSQTIRQFGNGMSAVQLGSVSCTKAATSTSPSFCGAFAGIWPTI
jgi:hypothetical protein